MAQNVIYTAALSHMIPRPRGPLRQTYPTRKLWDRLLPETRILETEIACRTL